MTKSMRALLVGAALSGFIAGTCANAMAQTGGDQKSPTPAESGKKATKTRKSHKGGKKSKKGSTSAATTTTPK